MRETEHQQQLKQRLPFSFAKRYGVLLLPAVRRRETEDREIDDSAESTFTEREVIFKSGLNITAFAEVRRFLGANFTCREVAVDAFDKKLATTYQDDSDEAMQMIEDLGGDMDLGSLAEAIAESSDLLEQQDDAPIIKLINSLLTEAIKVSASDIHIETYETRLVVRFRVDGVLREVVSPRRALAPLLVSRVKVMAKLDIAEKRVPQDGRISVRVAGKEVDVRVSTIPASNGERVVMRLLERQDDKRDLEEMGMNEVDFAHMHNLIKKPHGIILVTGPTGSGKTTTLYACLGQLNDHSRNILTVEDPIEYDVEGIGQTQVNIKADMTFSRGLRAILRQDPDVVMVGEIRDYETADIAVQASLTGHLVLSTIHTNTAIGALTRLANMGVQPYLLSNSIVGLVSQRLIRVLCPHCKQPQVADEMQCQYLRADAANPPTIYNETGCDKCANEGYRGRRGIYEIVIVDETLRRMIHNGTSEIDMEQYARTITSGLWEDGKNKILAGTTTIHEIMRVTMED